MDKTKPTISLDSNLCLHPYSIHREEDCDPLLALPERKAFLEVDDVSIRAVQLIHESASIDEAQNALAKEEGVDYDLLGLAELLLEKGFVASVDSWEDELPVGAARKRHPLLYKFGLERLAPYLQSHPFLLVALLPMTWVGIAGSELAAYPNPAHLLISSHPTINIIASLGGLLAMAYLHELAHFYTARRHGLNPTIHLSHRFYILVLQTDVTDAWTLPRRARLQIFLAGMTFNVIVASVFGIIASLIYLGHIEASATTLKMVRYVTYLNILPLLFQFFIPAKTDLYHALLTMTKRRNLMSDSMGYVVFLVGRGFRNVFQRQKIRCTGCELSIQPYDPFCFKCGTQNPAINPNKMPFTRKDHRPLLGFGLFFLIGSLLAYGYVLLIASGFMMDNIILSVQGFNTYLAQERYLMMSESIVALLLSTLQIAVLGTFLLQGIWGMFSPIVKPIFVALHVMVVTILVNIINTVLRLLPDTAAQRGRKMLILPLAATLQMEKKNQ